LVTVLSTAVVGGRAGAVTGAVVITSAPSRYIRYATAFADAVQFSVTLGGTAGTGGGPGEAGVPADPIAVRRVGAGSVGVVVEVHSGADRGDSLPAESTAEMA